MNKIDFGIWVRSERENRNWSQADLARESGLYRSLINNIENGVSESAPKTLKALGHAFNYPTDFVYEKADLLDPKPGNMSEEQRQVMHLVSQVDDQKTLRLILAMLDQALAEKK